MLDKSICKNIESFRFDQQFFRCDTILTLKSVQVTKLTVNINSDLALGIGRPKNIYL